MNNEKATFGNALTALFGAFIKAAGTVETVASAANRGAKIVENIAEVGEKQSAAYVEEARVNIAFEQEQRMADLEARMAEANAAKEQRIAALEE